MHCQYLYEELKKMSGLGKENKPKGAKFASSVLKVLQLIDCYVDKIKIKINSFLISVRRIGFGMTSPFSN